MTSITRLTETDRTRWAELWTGYLTFYHTVLPPEMYDLTWLKLFDGRIHGFGARDEAGRERAAVASTRRGHDLHSLFFFFAGNCTAREQLGDAGEASRPTKKGGARMHALPRCARAALLEASAAQAAKRGGARQRKYTRGQKG